MAVNKKRRTSELELPKPSKRPIKERESRSSNQEEARLLLQVGSKLTPDSHKYLGSCSVHFYKHGLADTFKIITHHSNLSKVSEELALEGSKELGRKLMRAYGHEEPRRRDDKPDKIIR